MENMDGDIMTKDIVIREFNIADRAVAARFAMEGMHLDRYVENALERWIYEKYVIREALARSNYLIGAYRDDKLVGFLFGCFKGQPLPYRDSRFIFLQRLFKLLERFSPSASQDDAYDAANRAMKASLRSEPDVEPARERASAPSCLPPSSALARGWICSCEPTMPAPISSTSTAASCAR